MADLERDYSPSSRVGGSAAPFIEDYQMRSASARVALGDEVRILPGGTVFVSAGAGSPLLAFVHGGYWQALSAADSLYLAPGVLAAGWSFAAVEYTIAPDGDVARMVAECAAALVQLAAFGGFERIVLVGHSAGAHLAAMVSIVHPPPPAVDLVVLVSGVFDLRPIVHTTVNDPLGLDEATAAALSPALLPVEGRPDVIVAWGDNDTDAFKAQGHLYAERLRVAGLSVTEREHPGRHHFDIVDEVVADVVSPRT